MFSKTCEYGIRASIFLAVSSLENKKVNQKEIASEIDSPIAFTAKILQNLARKNIISSSKGKGGGFFISKEKLPNIRLIEILEALDCNDTIKNCGLGLKDCSENHPCPIHFIYKEIKSKLKEMFENTYLIDLAKSNIKGTSFLKY